MMVTGGWAVEKPTLSSTEILTADGWVPGPPLPESMACHCQVTFRGKIYVTGKAGLLWDYYIVLVLLL